MDYLWNESKVLIVSQVLHECRLKSRCLFWCFVPELRSWMNKPTSIVESSESSNITILRNLSLNPSLVDWSRIGLKGVLRTWKDEPWSER